MKVLVTGCYGFIGSHTVRRLLAAGHEVVGVDRLVGARSPKDARVRALNKAGLVYVESDISDPCRAQLIVNMHRPDAIVHLAGQFSIRHGADAAEAYVNSNVRSFVNVCEAARINGVKRVIYSSTIAARTERPTSLYGATMRARELMASAYAHLGLEMVGLRYAAVYGPMMRQDAGIYRVAMALRKGIACGMLTGFKSKHEQVDIKDAAEVTARFADAALPSNYGIYLVAADDFLADFGDVVLHLADRLGVEPRYPEGFVLTPRHKHADLGNLGDVIGYVPRIRLERGMQRLAEWLVKQ